MDWNCADSDRRLSDYLERLTTPEETAAFSAHVEHCAECAALVARVGGTVRWLRAADSVEPPSHLYTKIIAATSRKPEVVRGWRKWLRPATIAWQPQFAMGAITVAASFLIIFHAANSPSAPRGFAALNPVNLYLAADRQIHLTYAHTAKFVSDMRLVYEIESRLQPDEDQSASPAQPPGSPAQPQPKSQTRFPRTSSGRVVAHGQYANVETSYPAESDLTAEDFDSEDFPLPETPDELHFVASRSHS
jgi:anti-sigma factor RsiW